MHVYASSQPLMHSYAFYVVSLLCTIMQPFRYAVTDSCNLMHVYADDYLCVHDLMLSYAMRDELCNLMLCL
jgi:hypothetical protein